MKTILKIIKKSYIKVLKSIAFYPGIICIGFLMLALGALNLESAAVLSDIKKEFPYFLITDYETARAILTTLIGGVLSLTVFSFTMVMLVLNQASSDFSPRLLPGLISNKRHQIILGIYIGSLLYCILVLIALGANGVDSQSLGLSTMIAAFVGVLCIGLFVYFIHNISGAVQIHNIINLIFQKSDGYLDEQWNIQKGAKLSVSTTDTDDWHTINCKDSGYFKGFDTTLLTEPLANRLSHIEVLPYLNYHLWEGMPLIKTKKEMSLEEQEGLLFCIKLSSDRHEGDKGIGGMIKLMEIAVKAMSPGINDPGTAIDAITKLGRLLRKFLKLPNVTIEKLECGVQLIRNTVTADELMRTIVQPIRLYSKIDSVVLYELVTAIHYILRTTELSDENKASVERELHNFKFDIENNIENDADRLRLLKLLSGGLPLSES